MRPPVSIVLPTYNRAHLLSKAVSSVLDQLLPNDELIIVDDGSTDDTERIIQYTFDSTLIRYIKTENQGAGAARNLGISESKGDLIGFVDSDNYWLPGKLDVQIAIMEDRKDLICCFTDFITTKSDGKTYSNGIRFWMRKGPSWIEGLKKIRPLDEVTSSQSFGENHTIRYGNIYSALSGGNYIPVWTALIRKEFLSRDDRFAVDVKTYEEWEFFAKVTRKGGVAFVDIETAHNLAHGSPRLTDINYINRIESELKIMERVWGVDKTFQEKQGENYRKTLIKNKIVLINHYLKKGAIDKLKCLLTDSSMLPMRYSLLKLIPPKLLTTLSNFLNR